jgi:hypothetical protein
MADAYIQLNSDGTGKKVDAQTIPNGNYRQTMTIGDPTTTAAVANVFQFHNSDNQVLGGSAYGLNTGGVSQLINGIGNLDRATETYTDGRPNVGIPTGSNQNAMPFATTLNGNVLAAATSFVVTAASGTTRGVAWSIQVGSILYLSGGTAEYVYVTAVAGTTITANVVNAHSNGTGVSGSVYNQQKDATLADGSTPAGINAGASYFWNNNLNSGTGGMEIERSASGELDGASGNGTAMAVGYEYNGGGATGSANYDRERNLQGKGAAAANTTTATVAASATTATATSTPTNLNPGQPLYFYTTATGAITEVVYMATGSGGYSAGTTALVFSATQLAHNPASESFTYDIYSASGPGLNGLLPTGLGIEEDVVYDPTTYRWYTERSHTQDGISLSNVVSEGLILYNGNANSTGGDRLKGLSGSAYVYEAYQSDSTNDSISDWEKGYTYTKLTASGSVVSTTCVFAGYIVEASTSGTLIDYDNTAASGNTVGGATAQNLTTGQIVIFAKPIILTTGLYATIGGTATINFLTRNVSK